MGANRHLGEAEAIIGTETYIVRLGTLELAELETKFDVVGVNAVWERALGVPEKKNADGTVTPAVQSRYIDWLSMAKVALKRHHPEIAKDENKVADLLDYRIDGQTVFANAISAAMWRTMPDTPDPKE